MKLQKIIFVLSLIGVLLLIVLAQNTDKNYTGKITSIKFSENKITIQLENFEEELILFNTNLLNLTKGDEVRFQGRQDTYKSKKQLIVDKIEKI